MSENLEILENWLLNNKDLILVSSPLIQTIGSLLLLAVTLIYVRATVKMVHLPFKTFLRPIEVGIKDGVDTWTFKLKNYGSGLAINVKASTVVHTSHRCINEKFISKSDMISANGNSELESGSIGEYGFKGLINFDDPIIVSWQSLTGKKYKKYWKVTIQRKDRIEAYGLKRWMKFHIKSCYIKMRSPFLRFICWNYDRKETQKVKGIAEERRLEIINFIGDKNHCFTEDIAEKLDIELDSMDYILKIIKKKGFINYNGSFVSITEAGKEQIKIEMKNEG